MTMYDRSSPAAYRLVDECEGGFGWLAHPEETGQRASHALVGDDDGVWLFDPLEAPGIDEEIESLGEVAAVAVCSSYHARDAAAFADRFDVPVFVPRWMDRVADRIDAPIERYDGVLGSSGFEIRRLRPLPGWFEAVAYRGSDRTLYVPDVMSTIPSFTVGTERLAISLVSRLSPPTDAFGDLEPERILVGHGTGIFEDATGALEDTLANARRRFPRALVTTGWTQLWAGLAALRD